MAKLGNKRHNESDLPDAEAAPDEGIASGASATENSNPAKASPSDAPATPIDSQAPANRELASIARLLGRLAAAEAMQCAGNPPPDAAAPSEQRIPKSMGMTTMERVDAETEKEN